MFSTLLSYLKSYLPSSSTEDHDEYEYIRLVRHVLASGSPKLDRTGTGTLSLFRTHSRYSLRNRTIPLLTTKRVFWRGVVGELLWFISGSTDAKVLSAKGIKIWDANGSRAFLDAAGFTDRPEGDLGPVYSHQWRHFGAPYVDCATDYADQGVDQVQRIIETLKSNPDDRRMILSAWNPVDLPQMALPPCHCFVQFYVNKGELSCSLYQRSGDIGLGVPFNIASYALLTHMLAHVTGLKAGEFIHDIGDAHIYQNHITPLKTQITRTPRPFPTLKIKRSVSEIDDFTADDFELIGYNPHPAIKMEMAV